MLRKRNRSAQKDQQMGDITSDGGFGYENCLQSGVLGQKQKTNAFFNVPGLFVGLSPRSALECDSVRSPTSPLDKKLFSNLSSSLWFSKQSFEGHQKIWDCNKVGLGSIVDDDGRNVVEKPIALSNSKTILIGLQIRSKAPSSPTYVDHREGPKSLPKNYPIFSKTKPRISNLGKGSSSDVLFEIGGDPVEIDPFEMIQSFSLDSNRLGSEIRKLGTRNVDFRTRNSRLEKVSSHSGSLSMSTEEIELSEDYTCVISHGPVPKTTHIFGDHVLEGHPSEVEAIKLSAPSIYPTNDFLSYCFCCKKKLQEGKDIYMYRGEKAFCSMDCRLEEISIEEKQEKSMSTDSMSENGDDILEDGILIAI